MRALERRYFDLKGQLVPELEAAQRRALAVKLSSLERDLGMGEP